MQKRVLFEMQAALVCYLFVVDCKLAASQDPRYMLPDPGYEDSIEADDDGAQTEEGEELDQVRLCTQGSALAQMTALEIFPSDNA